MGGRSSRDEGFAASGVELSLTATYPPDTRWKVYRDGEPVDLVTASGPLSALVRVGKNLLSSERTDGEWTVERVEP